MFGKLYKLKYDSPFIPFWIVAKDKRRRLVNRPQDLALPPNGQGRMLAVWHAGKCTVLKFEDIDLLKPKQRLSSRSKFSEI